MMYSLIIKSHKRLIKNARTEYWNTYVCTPYTGLDLLWQDYTKFLAYDIVKQMLFLTLLQRWLKL